jgi:all-trans-retinol 13,14-reductase
MERFDVVIIGAGLGGLLCGNILSKEGFRVCLIEKNHKLGGSLQTFGRKGCIFNTGLNYTESLEDGQVLNQYFRYFGVLDKLKLQRLDADGFEIIDFSDKQYRFAMGREHFIETLAREFPAEKNGLKSYCKRINDICRSISMYTFSEEQTNIIDNDSLNIGAADFIKSVISNNRLRNIIAGNNMLYAGSENKTPLYVHALINNSFIESAWRIADGSHNLVNILASNIISYGGTIIRNQKVSRLVMDKGKAGSAVLENGEYISGRNFIANIHPDLILDMVEPGTLRKTFCNRIRGLEDTMGMFTLYLVFKEGACPYANHNFYHFDQDNVWVASDYDSARWPQNYLYMHSAVSRSTENASCGSVITYMDFSEVKKWEHTYTGDRGEDYLAFKDAKANILLDAVGKQFPGIRDQIAAYYTSTPLTWRDYTGTRAGSAYGVLKDYNRPLESLVMPRTRIPNLYLTGQNINVHGILGVTISSFITCAELMDLPYLIRKVKAS